MNQDQDPAQWKSLPLEDPLAAALRSALSREADRVTPSPDGLVRIQDELRRGRPGWSGRGGPTGLPSGGGPRRVVLLAAAAAVVLAVAGVATSVTRRGNDNQPAGRPTSAPVMTTPDVVPSTAPGLPVYYPGTVGKSYGLFREFHSVSASTTTGTAGTAGTAGTEDIAQRVQQAITQAMSRRPDDPDYLVLWPAGANARTTMGSDQITITLNEAAAGGTAIAGPGADAIVIQQLIWTATAAAAKAGVSSAPMSVLIQAEGPTPDQFGSINLAQAFTRGTQFGSAPARAPVWIDSLGQDASVPRGDVTVSGQGIGGPVLRWTLARDGADIDSGQVRATTQDGGSLGAGLRGPWTITLDLPDPGHYTLSVTEAGIAGSDSGTDSKDFTVR